MLILLPLIVLAVALYALVRTHAEVLEVARGPRPVARTAAERRALLSAGDCAVARRGGALVGHIESAARASGFYAVQLPDVRDRHIVDTASVRVVPCASIQTQ